MRALVLCALVAVAAGCRTESCKPGTLLVSVSLTGSAAAASSLSVDVAIDGGGARSGTFALDGKSSGTIEVDFPSYPAGHAVTVTVTALAGSDVLGSQAQATTLGAGCATLDIVVSGSGSDDGGMGDGSPGFDGCVPATSCGAVACGKISDGCGGMLDCGGACQLFSLAPSVTPANGTLVLEGTFGAGTTVNFAGGVTATATVLGPHRATVAIPAGATSGSVSVKSGGTTTAALPLRITSFTPSLGSFNSQYEQTQYAREGSYASYTRSFYTTVVTSKYLYVLDGNNNAGTGPDTERALINADGTLGVFNRDLNAGINFVRKDAGTAIIGNYVYVIGGYNRTTASIYDSVERSSINADGTLSAFTVQNGVTLTNGGRRSQATVVIGNNVYAIGGIGIASGSPIASIERATIGADGSLSTFATVTTSTLVTPRADATALVTNGWLYMIGGTSSDSVATIERAPINGDGSLGGFTLVNGVTLTTARAQQASVVLGDTIYVLAGVSPGQVYKNTIEQATIKPDGSITTFSLSPVSTLGAGLSGSAATVIGNFLYFLNGESFSGGVGFQRASIDGTGALGSFALDSSTHKTTAGGACSAVIGDRVYIFGSTDANGDNVLVQYATVAPDGTLSMFADAGVMLNTPRRSACCAVHDGLVHVIGGYRPDTELSSIETATINDDNTLGAFAIDPVSLSTAVQDESCFIAGNKLFVVGGEISGGPMAGFQNIIQKSTFAIGPGTLGAFSQGAALVSGRMGHTNFVLDDTVYIIAGEATGALPIEQSTIASDGSLGAFSNSSAVPPDNIHDGGSLLLGNNLYLLASGTTIYQASFLGGLGSFAASAATLSMPSGSPTYAFGNRAYAIGSLTVQSTILP